MSTEDLAYEEFEELSLKKKAGDAAIEENLRVDARHHQDYLATDELKEEILVAHVYGQKPYENFLALVDPENHRAVDNVRSDKHLERVKIAERLLQLLGWEHARDENQLEKDLVKDNFVEKVVSDPLFKKQLRLNELFGLDKSYNIHTAMTPQQILMWANSLLKPFCLQIRAGEKFYRMEPQLEVMEWVARKSKRGKVYKDSRNLLNQQVKTRVAEEEDLFLDDEVAPKAAAATGKATKARKRVNTDLLDVGINHADE